MATTQKEATRPGQFAQVAAVRRENVSASAAADWGVASAAEDLQRKNLTSLIRPDPASKATAKGFPSHFTSFIFFFKFEKVK